MDLRYPNTLSTFLQIDPLGEYDECVMRKQLYLNSLYRNIRNAFLLLPLRNNSGAMDFIALGATQ